MGEAEDPPEGTKSAWRRRVAAVPRGVWALVIAPVIPIIAATLMTSWLDGDDTPERVSAVTATATAKPTWDVTSAENTEQSTLGDFLENDTAARDRLRALLDCEGWVFKVELEITGADDAQPRLRWTLREDEGIERNWVVPPALESMRTVPVDPSASERRVWIAAPARNETWRVKFELFASPANVPDEPEDTLRVKEPITSIVLPSGWAAGECELDGAT